MNMALSYICDVEGRIGSTNSKLESLPEKGSFDPDLVLLHPV